MNHKEVIIRLNKTYKKWADCKSQMVGTLYPQIIESKYLIPIRIKLNELKYHPNYKSLDFYAIYKEVN